MKTTVTTLKSRWHQLHDDEDVGVDMSPLIDCVFLLLIFFLVATTLKKIEPEIRVDLPESAAAIETPQQDDLLIIAVDEVGRVHLSGGAGPAGNNELHDALRRHAQGEGERRVRLDVDRRAPFEHVVRVVEQCTFEGLTNVGFHTRKPERRGY